MKKKYVSVLEVLYSLMENGYQNDIKTTLGSSNDYVWVREFSPERGILKILGQDELDHEDDVTGQLHVIADTNHANAAAGNGQIRAAIPYINVMHRLKSPNPIAVPEILEIHFLKSKWPGMGSAEWGLIEQMLLLFLAAYHYVIGGHEVRNHDWQTFDLLAALEEGDFIYELDVEQEPNSPDSIINKAYQKFTPYAIQSETAQKQQCLTWTPAIMSTMDGAGILHMLYKREYTHGDFRNYYSKVQPYLPWFMLFSVLEQGRDDFKEISFKSYQDFKSKLVIAADALPTSPDAVLCQFSYSLPYGNSLADDRWLYQKIMGRIKKKMREAVGDSVTTLSVNDMNLIKQWDMGRIAVLLNKETLSWGDKDNE